MNNLTKEEFTDRILAIQRARRIFIDSGLTDNISIAFENYQDLLAGRERAKTISLSPPDCECGSKMFFLHVPPNAEGIKLQIVCTNPRCDTVFNSEHDVLWWIDQMAKEQRV